MLTAHETQLIAAAVDGELSGAQSHAFRQLLAAKPAAAELFRALQADAARLRYGAIRPIPVSQVSAVLARTRSGTQPKIRRAAPTTRSLLLHYAIAASVFFTLCSASLWVFTAGNRREQERVQQGRLPVVNPTHATPEQDSFAIARSVPRIPDRQAIPEVLPVPPEVVARKPQDSELAPAPRSAIGDVVGSGIIENPKPLTENALRLPYVFAANELDRMDVQTRLKEEFAQDPAFRLDLFSKNAAAALELLQASAKQVGVTVSVDARTQDLIAKKIPVPVAFFLDGLTAPELAALLGSLGKQLQIQNPASLGAAHLVPMGGADFRDVKESIGIDLIPARPTRASGEPKSVSADTLGKVTGAVKKATDKAAIAVAFLPANARTVPAQSKEIKAFLDKRGDRKAGTLPLLIVIRPQA